MDTDLDSVARLIAEVMAKFRLSRPLVVTDPFMVSSGMVNRVLEPLKAAGLNPGVFSDTIPEPEDTIIENGVAVSRHTAVVGKPDRPSPDINSRIVEINFNPYWTMPVAISSRRPKCWEFHA